MINAEKYNRSVTLLCPTCGSSQFEYDTDDENDTCPFKCNSCQLVMTRAQLIEANSENISEHIEEMGNDLVGDLQTELRKALSGNKFIKIK